MQLCDLPNDVLHLILKASFTPCHGITPALRKNLPLLAVCRRWRSIALADVYSGVNISYYSLPGSASWSGVAHANNATDDSSITTNLALVASSGCVQMARRVDIVVSYKATPLTALRAVIRLMRTAAEEWKGARCLEIVTIPNPHMPARITTNVASYEAEIRQTSAALVAIMPGVCRVSFTGFGVNPVVWALKGQLAVLYSDRLESLVSSHPITVPPDHTFRQLKHASIGYDSSISYQHPRVDPARLVSLVLSSWPSDHSWVPFSADDDSGTIVFPNLKKLDVSYSFNDSTDGVKTGHSDGHPWRLHFPKLDKLSVSCIQGRCPLLEYAVLPPRMGEISIEATALILVSLAEMGLLVSRSITVIVDPDPDDSSAALAAANRLLESAQASKEEALVVHNLPTPMLLELVTCTSLTALDIWIDTSVDTMLGLIRMRPNLTKLHIRSLTLRNIQEDISVPGPDEDCLVEPFNTRIREMHIRAGFGSTARELVPVAKYLLPRIPTLVRLCLANITREPIAEFVDAYSKRYPHLAGVKLCDDD